MQERVEDPADARSARRKEQFLVSILNSKPVPRQQRASRKGGGRSGGLGTSGRERAVLHLAAAVVAFPGGFGTMEEIIEMLTWKQLGIHGKPIVFANIGGYFDPLLAQFDVAIRSGYARPEDRILFAVAENTKSILTLLDGAPVLSRNAGGWA